RDLIVTGVQTCALPIYASWLLLLAGAGLARAERRRQHVGFRSGREEGLRSVSARESGATGARAPHRLRTGGARLVRYASDDERRPRAALYRHRPIAAAGDADRRTARRRRRLPVDRRQRRAG